MKCPGQDTRYWKEDAIFEVKCPHCGHLVEFFKDDTARTCSNCGQKLPNPHLDFGCAAYCPYAEQCLGSLPPELKEKQKFVFKERIEAEMMHLLKDRPDELERLRLRIKYAEQIALEEGGSLPILLAAACVWGWKEPEKLLRDLKVPEEMLKEVLETLKGESKEAFLLKDADLLARSAQGEEIEDLPSTNTAKRLLKSLKI